MLGEVPKCRVPTLLFTKNFRIFSGPQKSFSRAIIAQLCLNIQTNNSYLLYIHNVSFKKLDPLLFIISLLQQLQIA